MLSESELRDMLDEAMRLAGEDFEIVRNDNKTSVKAIKQTQKGHNVNIYSFIQTPM